MVILQELSYMENTILGVSGCPRELNAIGGLSLVLMWYYTRESYAHRLVMNFGQTSTPLYKWLMFDRKIFLSILIDDQKSWIRPP